MEEEKVMKHKRKEKRDMMNGGPKFDPHIKVTAELLSQLPKKKILFFLFPFLFHS